jgi:Na+-translocating ferredoxin:NAD+ oxidoreductase RnfG subunit
LTTNIFRNSTLTAKKVKAIKELIARIENAESLEIIEQALQEKADTELLSSKITKGVEKTLGKCMAMIIIAKKHDDCQLHKNFSIRLDGAN